MIRSRDASSHPAALSGKLDVAITKITFTVIIPHIATPYYMTCVQASFVIALVLSPLSYFGF